MTDVKRKNKGTSFAEAQPKSPKSGDPKMKSKESDSTLQKTVASELDPKRKAEAKGKFTGLDAKGIPHPKSQAAVALDAKTKPGQNTVKDAKALKAEVNANSKSDITASKAALDSKGNVDPKTQKRVDQVAKDKSHLLSPMEELSKEELSLQEAVEFQTVRVPETGAVEVNPFRIPNVYEHYLHKHPPPKPWSFDMSPPRQPKVAPILDPFKWSKAFEHPWGEERTKDPATIAEEERLASLEAARLAKKYIRPCLPGDHHHKRVSVYCQPDREPIYKLDIYGNPKLNEAGNPIHEPIYMLNSHGTVLLDGEGHPLSVYLLDAEGNVQLDAEGQPIPGPTYMLDAEGNALLDQAGHPVPEPPHVDLLDDRGNVVVDEFGHPRHQEMPVYMLDAEGHVMLDPEGNLIHGRSYMDLEGNVMTDAEGKPIPGRFQYGHLDDEGLLVFDADGDIVLDAEGAPLLERQETTEEKKFRLAMEAEVRKAKVFQEKLEKDRIMMLTPLPKKPVPWRKYYSMNLPRSLKTVVRIDRGTPGDDWRKFVKKYTIEEMNHRVAVQLHGKTGVIWRKLHEHITYLQNPRYAAHIKQFKALRIFRIRETKEGQEYDLIDPHVLYFDGFEPTKTYLQHLRIYNVSPWTQRIRVIKPATEEYFITSPEEIFQGKNLVSGNKCDFDVIFQPPSVLLYKDAVTIKTEMQTLPLVLEAINPYPVVILPTFVDMGLCLSGHTCCYHYTLTSKGAGAEFYFQEYETTLDYHTVIEDPRYDDLKWEYFNNNILYAPPFMFYPRMFDTTADLTQEFIVLFRPPRSGVYNYIVQLLTETGLHWEMKFKGTGVDLRLNLQKMDGKDFLPGQAELGVSFGYVTVSHTRVKEVTVRSQTPLPLRFYWRIQDKHLHLENEEDPECTLMGRIVPIENLREFVPEPQFGVFPGEIETSINFKFTPSDVADYQQVACLYVDTRKGFPLSSDVWKCFREALLLVEYGKANRLADERWDQRVLWGIDRSAFECSDQKLAQDDLQQIVSRINKIFHVSETENTGTVFRIAEIDLSGSGYPFEVDICPKLYQFAGILNLGQTHEGSVDIVNRSPTLILFKWNCPKTPYGIIRNESYVFPMSGEIQARSFQKIRVTTMARKVGRIEFELHCLIESPHQRGKLPLSLKVEGHVVGPSVILAPPIIDFGLCQIDSTYSLSITLTNKSKYADAPFRIFSTQDSQLPASSPFVPESQMNPRSLNTKVPVDSRLFAKELEAKPALLVPPPTMVTLMAGFCEEIQEVRLPPAGEEQLPPNENIDPSTSSRKQGECLSNSNLSKAQTALKSEPGEELAQPGILKELVDPPCPLDPHGFSGSCCDAQLVSPANLLEKEVSPEFIPAPQKRAPISRAYGEIFQVFNDGITDPKLPPTTLFQHRDPYYQLPPRQPLPPLDQPPESTLMTGIPNRTKQKVVLLAEDFRQTKPTDLNLTDHTNDEQNEGIVKELKQPCPSTHSRLTSYIDTSLLHEKGLPVITEQKVLPAIDTPGNKPFLEQMGIMGSLPQTYGPSGPPVVKSERGVAIYEEDLRQSLVFEPPDGIVAKGNNSVTIKVTLTGTICGFMRLAIVCEISEGLSPTQYAICRANIDAPEACIIPSLIDLRTKFINIPITINVVIRNLKALPACFNWPNKDRVGGAVRDLDVEVTKQRGEIGPKLEWGLRMNLIPRKLGILDTILICNVFKMINPLGLQLKAIVVDARISYHVLRPDKEDGHQKSGRKVAHQRILMRRQQNSLGNPVEQENPDNWVDPQVPCLDFGRRKSLGRAHCLKLVLRNHSPIEVKVQLTVGKYVAEPLASLVKDEAWVISSLTERLSYLIPVRRDPFQSAFKRKERDENSEFHLNTPALTDISDTHLKYFSQPGKQTLWRRAEGAMHEALIKEGMPLAFLCYPSYSGVIKPWSDWSVEVVCFSNLPGNYMDILTSKVGRLAPVDLPMEVEICGTPLVARRNWLEPKGLQQPDDEGEITVAWQPMPAGQFSVSRQFWVRNQSPFHIELNWEQKEQATKDGGKFVTMTLVVEEDILTHAIVLERPEWYAADPTAHVFVKQHIGIVYENQVHCVFKDYLMTPDENFRPFSVTPNRQVILGHNSYPFEVHFHENRAKSYSSILVGYQRIYDGKITERRRSTQFVFDSTFDRKDDQYIYRRPEKKHLCEHVVTFYSKKDDSFTHTLAHKTSIVDPADPEILALELTEEGTKPKRLSRFHCSDDSNSSSSSDDEKQKAKKITKANAAELKSAKQQKSIAKVVNYLNARDTTVYGLEPEGHHQLPLGISSGTIDGDIKKDEEGMYSRVHDIAYLSESEEEEPKYQFDIRRRSTRKRRISTGREVNFSQAPDNAELDVYTRPQDAAPLQIDLSETLSTAHCKNFFTFEAIRPLRVSLEATVLVPRLRTNLDGALIERLSFQCFGNDHPDSRFDVRTLLLTNDRAVSAQFVVNVEEPFRILNIHHGILQPGQHGDQCQQMSILHNESNEFRLEADHTLQFNILYSPQVDECLLDPPDVAVESFLRIRFLHCDYDQIIPLYGRVLFPELRLMTDILHFGEVVTATVTQATDFSLSNPSLPDADWRIVTEQSHLETVALATRGIAPKWEDSQGLCKIWPVIWSANPEQGVTRGRRENEMGATNEIQYFRNRSIVTISFAPFDIMDYELNFWVEVRLGRGVRVALRGTGINESPQAPLPLPPPTKGKDGSKGKDENKGKDGMKGKDEGKGETGGRQSKDGKEGAKGGRKMK